MRPIASMTAAITLLCGALAFSQLAAPDRAAAQGSAGATGETLFKQRCAMCHAISGKGGKLGPDLTGVVGRKAGAGAFAYSPAMKSSKTVWNASTLDAYLASPTKAIPGTRMVVSVSKPEDRKALIGYLAAAGK